jgi:uncharacterized protein (TIGR00297 family)
MTAHSEYARQIVHMSMAAFALLLRYLTWWQAALLALLALAFNLLVLPGLAPRLYRPSELARRWASGIVLYPAAVLALILVFAGRLDLAAAAWGILAIGDGMATIAGRTLGRRRLPWNREKSVTGLLALFLLGGSAGAVLAWWCRDAVTPPPPLWMTFGAPFLAALAAAFAESIPVRLDDNISVPAAAAASLWAMSMVTPEAVAAALPMLADRLPLAVLLNAGAAALGFAAGTVTASGAVCGAVIGVLVLMGAGPAGWVLLLATFVAAAASSRLGLRRKALLGIAEERGGRRGPGNAIANTGVAAIAAMLAVLTVSRDAALVAFVAALTAGGSDTVASEIGKACGRRTYLVVGFRQVPPGTSGAISIEGTMAGLAGAGALAGMGLALGLIGPAAFAPAVIGAALGGLAESALGATLEAPGILNNDLLNFLNTAIAAAAAVLLARALA